MQKKHYPFQTTGHKIAIVASRFNGVITDLLVKGALETFERFGGDSASIHLLHVPGALEIPYACQKIAQTNTVHGIVALGAVIKGASSHYDLVVQGAYAGVQKIMLDHSLPITLGILTVETQDQAWERAGLKMGNKGAEAMAALIELINLVPEK